MNVLFTRLARLALVWLCLLTPAQAQQYYEPARGTELRSMFMDLTRMHVESAIRGDIVFVVEELRVLGDKAFAILNPQNRDGSPAVPYETYESDDMNGTQVVVFFVEWDDLWWVEDMSVGATDLWWGYGPICGLYRGLIDDFCTQPE